MGASGYVGTGSHDPKVPLIDSSSQDNKKWNSNTRYASRISSMSTVKVGAPQALINKFNPYGAFLGEKDNQALCM